MTLKIDEVLAKTNDDLKYYEVQFSDEGSIMCEDGEYRVRPGYAVVNTLTRVREHTTTLLPGAIFQAQHLDATLDGLLNPQEMEYPSLEDVTLDDVVAN